MLSAAANLRLLHMKTMNRLFPLIIAVFLNLTSYGAAEGQGAEGKWVDQRGSFMAAVAAGPVFRLLGKKDLGTTEFPAVETALIGGDLAWRQHSGGHTVVPNWPTFLQWASRYIKTTSPSKQTAQAK